MAKRKNIYLYMYAHAYVHAWLKSPFFLECTHTNKNLKKTILTKRKSHITCTICIARLTTNNAI